MKFTVLAVLASFTLGAQAHFGLLYPEPRGPFVADREPLFCGGYNDATTNRTTFPLTNGFFRIRQGHPDWAASVLISVEQNPTSFDNFSVAGQAQYVRLWANESQTGNFCIPLDVASANIPAAVDGANVTIQVVLTGADGELYQCADLTLTSNFTAPDDLGSCVNSTATDTSHAANTTTRPAGSGQVGRVERMSLVFAFGTGLLGAVVAITL